ncbi:signal transduction histidine kinase [Chitinophaga dinghuensis]|uniref:histidine kinase n=1 Tax=Chitinophaga dinghuensis TaxID=1539050 RepID=A0A327VZM9_9BACT|nr:histidine kinase dimerization/phospho-acceptor domain-containing protein [Chitinophaga dinghuensis]RAJ80214.1 signal transduction histidine kinase [Chitinophaga dinghuensis]
MTTYSEKGTISILKKLSYLVAILSLTGGMTVGKVLHFTPIYYLEGFLGIFFFMLPSLPRYIGLNLTICTFFVILNAALVFYGIILGPLAEVHLLASFLFGASCCLLRGKRILIFPTMLVLSMLVFLELNYSFGWFSPIHIASGHATIIRWIVLTAGTGLTGATIFYYVQFSTLVNTRFHRLNEKLRISNEKLEEAMEAKSRYVDMVSHELRTPLNSILGVAQLFYLKKNELDQELRGEVDHLLGASMMCQQVINNVLDLSRLNSIKNYEIKRNSIDLKDLVESTYTMQRYVANGRGVNIHLSYQDNLPSFIYSDELLCLKILNNLFSNMVKYAPPHTSGEIRISCDQQFLYFQTINAGAIEGPLLDKLFAAFSSSAVEENSTGLGLFLSRTYARHLKGDILVHSDANHTVFSWKLPLEISHEKKVKSSLFSTPGSLKGYKILVVDDNQIERSIITKRIGHTGAACITAESVEEALQKLQEKPNLILCDFYLGPTSTSEELIDYIRSNEEMKHLPIILATGDVERVNRRSCAEKIDGLLLKPYSLSDLQSALRKHLVPVRLLLSNKVS